MAEPAGLMLRLTDRMRAVLEAAAATPALSQVLLPAACLHGWMASGTAHAAAWCLSHAGAPTGRPGQQGCYAHSLGPDEGSGCSSKVSTALHAIMHAMRACLHMLRGACERSDINGTSQEPLYLHQLCSGSSIALPEPAAKPANPELQARRKQLQANVERDQVGLALLAERMPSSRSPAAWCHRACYCAVQPHGGRHHTA
jgi:hypothetical protein